MGLAETAKLVARLDLEGNFQTKLRGAAGALSNFDRRFSNTSRALGRTAHNLQVATVAIAGAAVTGLTAAVKVAADFESQLNTINTIARATPEALGEIGDGLRKVATSTGTALSDLTTGYYDLLSAGIKSADAQNVLVQANTLAIGSLSTTTEAIDLLTTAINVYGGDASQAAKFTDQFAKAVERGKVKADEIAGSYAQVAPLARQMGIENEEIAATYARLTAAGTPAAEAATQMASALTALLKKTPDLEKLEKATRKDYAALAGSKGLVAALEEMRVDADKAGLSITDLVGRKEALLYILQTTGPNLAAYTADLAAMGDAAGTAAGQMAERQKGLNAQLNILRENARSAGITIGTALLPKLTPLVKKLNEFVQANEGKIQDFAGKIAEGFDKVAAFIGSVNWQPFIDGLRVSAEIAQTIFAGFRALPGDVQAALVGVAAVNKVTGGLITGIAKDLGKILIERYGARGSSAANPLWVQSATGGVGGPGGGGLFGNLFKFAAGALVVTGVVALATDISGINDPKHRIVDPVTGKPRVFRGTNIASEQLAFQQQAAEKLRERIAAGERGMVEKQLVAVEGEIAKLTALTTAVSDNTSAVQGLTDQRRGEIMEGGKGSGATGVRAMIARFHEAIKGYFATIYTNLGLDPTMGHGGAALRDAAKKGNLDEAAGKLVDGFKSSNAPSLRSMQDNLAVLKGLAADGDAKTRKLLDDDIKSLELLIDQRLTTLATALASFTRTPVIVEFRQGEHDPNDPGGKPKPKPGQGDKWWQEYAKGGVVPGPAGRPNWAVVHGGETVLPVGYAPTAPVVVVVPPGARDNWASQQNIRRYSPLPPRAL